MTRNILALIAGYATGSSLNMGIIQLNMHVLYPMPPGMNMSDPVQFNQYIGTLPTLAFVVVILAHLSQAFVGGWVAARLSHSHPFRLALFIGALSLAGGIAAMSMIEGPAWLIVELPLYIAVAWVAGRLEEGRRQQAS
ncbi:MAG: hypothetical protein HOI23_06635 [Deltaproteobacteria bacterium]|jgi:hypothetical protein|nr:hypothetical protein [Deltaproteobacteria bacterium]MBT6435802.1 hypothetical protein [Deltaproteobacteria bacterium]